MKAKLFVIGLFLFALAACTQRAKVPEPVEGPSEELSAIDSLMWRQPDSALVCLLPYFDTCNDGMSNNSTPYVKHYANLLLAELLYKNDYEQKNRPDLLQAVTYYDSLMVLADTLGVSLHESGRRDTRRASAQNTTATIAFLDARAHYINGVGYYEQGNMVEACTEYLKALEVMEEHFEEKELVRHKARFMVYINNRLGDMFSEQFMMESAIECYKNSYMFSSTFPISSYSIPNALYRIGKQFNMKGNIDSANYYYSQAIERIVDTTNVFYRDMVSSQALLSYQLTHRPEASIQRLKQMIVSTNNQNEILTRYYVIGDIFFEEHLYDSAVFYLEPVFESNGDFVSQIQAAQFLHIIYDSLENHIKSDECMRFLAQQKKSEGQNKALVSQLEDIFQRYKDKKQEKFSEKEREKAIKKVINVFIPIAIIVVLSIIIIARLKGKKMLDTQKNEANRELEKERAARNMEKKKLQQGIQQREEQVRTLEKALNQQREMSELRCQAFLKEAICSKINDSVRSIHITAREGTRKNVALSEDDAAALHEAVLRHYKNFDSVLLSKNPKMGKDDFQLCQLYLLGLDERQIAALQCKSYSAIKKRAATLKELLGIDESLPDYLLKPSTFQ